jgi:hypothetical protein
MNKDKAMEYLERRAGVHTPVCHFLFQDAPSHTTYRIEQQVPRTLYDHHLYGTCVDGENLVTHCLSVKLDRARGCSHVSTLSYIARSVHDVVLFDKADLAKTPRRIIKRRVGYETPSHECVTMFKRYVQCEEVKTDIKQRVGILLVGEAPPPSSTDDLDRSPPEDLWSRITQYISARRRTVIE